jgi:prevent-host-death family protein
MLEAIGRPVKHSLTVQQSWTNTRLVVLSESATVRILIDEAANRLDELVERAFTGEEVVILREGFPDVCLVPVLDDEVPRRGTTGRKS